MVKYFAWSHTARKWQSTWGSCKQVCLCLPGRSSSGGLPAAPAASARLPRIRRARVFPLSLPSLHASRLSKTLWIFLGICQIWPLKACAKKKGLCLSHCVCCGSLSYGFQVPNDVDFSFPLTFLCCTKISIPLLYKGHKVKFPEVSSQQIHTESNWVVLIAK